MLSLTSPVAELPTSAEHVALTNPVLQLQLDQQHSSAAPNPQPAASDMPSFRVPVGPVYEAVEAELTRLLMSRGSSALVSNSLGQLPFLIALSLSNCASMAVEKRQRVRICGTIGSFDDVHSFLL